MTTLSTPHPASAPARTTVDGSQLRRTLTRHAAGVTVLTAPGPVGFTATSFTPVSLDPALVSFYIGSRASALPTLRRQDEFAVNILGHDQAALAARFAQKGIDRFADVDWTTDQDGVPLLRGVPAWLRARITLRQPIGDHVLMVGEVIRVGGSGFGDALVHHSGRIVGVAGGVSS